MRPGRIAALVIGCLLAFPAIALLFGGSALGLGYLFGRGNDGYFDTTLERLSTESVAITAEDIAFAAEPGSPDWVIDSLDADVRLRATSAAADRDVFIGIGREADVDAYLAGVAHVEVTDLTEELDPVYSARSGGLVISPPVEQDFWVTSAAGPGTQQLDWEPSAGRWAAVLMNADGSPVVAADVNVGVKAAFLLPLMLIMLGIGSVLTVAAVGLIIAGAHGASRAGAHPPPPVAQGDSLIPAMSGGLAYSVHPVVMTAQLDPELSRWKWLVKWFLAIPHFIVLGFMWVAFTVLTFVAAVAIVFTGKYPRGIFDFNVGVLRWSWRVSYYATSGGIGTDRYPAFSLHPEAEDLATLDVDYPKSLSRPLVFVKWLLAIPHLIIVSLLAGTSVRWLTTNGDRLAFDPAGGGGLLGLLVLAAGVVLLFSGNYPRALFDLIIGFNRWIYRTVAYVALMTDVYPPFRLDQGGGEPPAAPPTPSSPDGSLDLTAPPAPADQAQVSPLN